MNEIVTYRKADAIASITMDDGKVNALSPRMLAQLNGALDRAEADRAVVLLCGRSGVFSAGFDLTVLRAGGDEARAMIKAGFELAERLLRFPTPVLIACEGHALAMGAFLLLSVDHRIGVQGAFRIGANEVAIGLLLPDVALEICRQRLTPAHFQRAVINAEIYAPESAIAAGFFDQVVAPSELPPAAQRTAVGLAGLNMPAHAAMKLRARAPALQAIRRAIEQEFPS